MKVWILALLAVPALLAADSQQLSLSLKAQADYERVELSAIPPLHDTVGCMQSQAALLAVAAPSEVSTIQYRRGYCALAGATLSQNAAEFAAAAAAFDKAIQAWPGRYNEKHQAPEPVSAGLRVLAAVARLEAAGTDDTASGRARQELSEALGSATCLSRLMTEPRCENVIDLGRQWLGAFALREGNWPAASQDFAPATAPAWAEWTSGKQAFAGGSYSVAAGDFRKAVAVWESRRDMAELPILERLAPQPEMASAYADLGGARLLAGDATGAIASLNLAIKEDPSAARSYYLRARAKEAAGEKDAALADYNMASRTAFAAAKDLASGEAHLYRGILLYRRKDFTRAEDEFSSAMNFEIGAGLRADARAWRYMAAVAEGSCQASRELLQQSLAGVTPYFPRAEAQGVLAGCPALASDAGVHPAGMPRP